MYRGQNLTSEKEQFYIQRIAELEKQVAELLKVNAELAEQVAKLTDKIASLSKNSSNSSKPPSSDIVKPAKTKQSDGLRRQGGQLGHKGINRPPFGPDQIDETIPLYTDSCDCGYQGHGEPIEEPKVQQTVELNDNPLTITEYRMYGFICPKCGRVIWAKLPAGVIDGQLFGPRLQALVGYMKGSLHASYSSLESFFSEVLNIDETGWKDKGVKYWAWVFCTPILSFFCIAKSRSSKVLEEILGKTYGGTIVSDFFSAYIKYANKLQQFCLAHLIRDIKFLTTLPGKNDKDFGEALLLQFKNLFRFWHQRDKIPKDRFDRRMLRIKKRVLALAEQEDLPAQSATWNAGRSCQRGVLWQASHSPLARMPRGPCRRP
jgi:transposase